MIEDILLALGYAGVLAISFGLNLIPFASPSNLVIAGAIAALMPSMNPALIGLIVAVAASAAKIIHFYTASLLGARLSAEKKGRLSKYAEKIGKWGLVGAFLVAATPIPDDPVVIPLGLARYNAFRFFVAYFFGKLTITVFGAYAARFATVSLEEWIGGAPLLILSLALTVGVLSAMFKYDPEAFFQRVRRIFGKNSKSL